MTGPQFDISMVRMAIASGVCDDYLDSLHDTIRARQQSVGLSKAAGLAPGDKFYFAAHIRPTCLAGALVEFVSWEGKDKLKTRLLHDCGTGHKWRQGSIVTIPSALIGELK